MEKYYTPTIEELLSFIMSEKCAYGILADSVCFIKLIFPDPIESSICDLIRFCGNKSGEVHSIDPSLYRLPYLNKYDIESFEFEEEEVTDCDSEDCTTFVKGYVLYQDEFNWKTIIPKKDNKYVILSSFMYNEHSGNHTIEVWFYGIIKNKSELKVILKQLGI